MRPVVLIVCNALDDETRRERGITTDSPAASRKVFLLSRTLRHAGIRPYVVSLGRGRAGRSWRLHRATARRVGGIPVIYVPFHERRILSEVISLLAPVGLLWRLARTRPRAALFYNRMPAYLAALFAAVALRYRRVLDLEDGEVPSRGRFLGIQLETVKATVYDAVCRHGALLACSALTSRTRVRPTLCYYGVIAPSARPQRWSGPVVTCLMSGTLSAETGAEFLVQCLERLRRDAPKWASGLAVEVTGMGPSLDAFRRLAASPGQPLVTVHGRTTNAEYQAILGRCEVGLALKPVDGALSDTTFPSKVVEFAGEGMLVVSTDISDVRRVLGDGALYLTRNDVTALLAHLERIVRDRAAASRVAEQGARAVEALCAPERAGTAVAELVFGGMS